MRPGPPQQLAECEEFDEVIGWYSAEIDRHRDRVGPYWYSVVYTEVKDADGTVRYELHTTGGLP